jgi:outer membrane protein
MRVKRKHFLTIAITGIIIAIVALVNPFNILTAADEARGRIAYVDVQQVFNIHPDKVAAEKQLNQKAQNLQSDLEEKAKELSKNKQQEILKQYQSQLSEKEQKLIQNVLVKIEDAIKKVAEKKEVKMVLDKKNVIYGGYDMTQDVIDYIKSNPGDSEDQNKETGTTQ